MSSQNPCQAMCDAALQAKKDLHQVRGGGGFSGYMLKFLGIGKAGPVDGAAANLMMCFDLVVYCLVTAGIWQKNDARLLYEGAAWEPAGKFPPISRNLAGLVWGALHDKGNEKLAFPPLTPGQMVFFRRKDNDEQIAHVAIAVAPYDLLEVNREPTDHVAQSDFNKVKEVFGMVTVADPPPQPVVWINKPPVA